MDYNTLISVSDLYAHLGEPDWAIIDCRFSLADTASGRRHYRASHIPGAVYAHLDEDLCAPVIPGITGRHPLPEVERVVEKFSSWGIGPGVQVVVYDDWPGACGAIAVRLWWMLRWLGHEAVAVLDGGWPAWRKAGFLKHSGDEQRPARWFQAQPHPEFVASWQDVDRVRMDPSWRVFDSRSLERYRGENETIDPVAGHIPGAWPAPYLDNMAPEGGFRSQEELAQRFSALLNGTSVENTIFYCGSGVTAALNVLAMSHAGLGMPKLYVGSWSEWITDPARPVEK